MKMLEVRSLAPKFNVVENRVGLLVSKLDQNLYSCLHSKMLTIIDSMPTAKFLFWNQDHLSFLKKYFVELFNPVNKMLDLRSFTSLYVTLEQGFLFETLISSCWWVLVAP